MGDRSRVPPIGGIRPRNRFRYGSHSVLHRTGALLDRVISTKHTVIEAPILTPILDCMLLYGFHNNRPESYRNCWDGPNNRTSVHLPQKSRHDTFQAPEMSIKPEGRCNDLGRVWKPGQQDAYNYDCVVQAPAKSTQQHELPSSKPWEIS